MVLKFFLGVCSCSLLVACSSSNSSESNNPVDTSLPMSVDEARAVYAINCASCHGQDGKLGASGAKDLSKSNATDGFIKNTIAKGNDKGMMPYDQILGKREIDGLVKFVKTLRTTNE